MDSLEAMISSVLNDPQKMRQFQDMAQSLGLGGDQQSPPTPEYREQPSGDSAPPQSGGPDLSSLLGMLGSNAGQSLQQPVRQQTGTPDLSSLLGMLGSNAGQSQQQPVQQQANTPDLSSLLGMLGSNAGQSPQQPAQQQTGMPDLSSLLGMLGSNVGQSPQQPAQQQTGMPDLSSLLGMLGSNAGQSQQQAVPQQQNGFNLSALTNMLGGPVQAGPAPTPAINMDVIMKLGQAMASMQSNRQNIDFLLSLKPKLNEKRAKKVDDAIKVMQLIQFLPLIQESGLFGGLDNLLGGLGGSGIGSLLGGLTGGSNGSGGLGGILNGLLRKPPT